MSSALSVPLLKTFSPLRYPGGKAKLASYIKRIIEANGLSDGLYVEPYAGGAGVACELLLQGYVSQVVINDINRAVWAFWHSIVFEGEAFVRLIRDTPAQIDVWDKQRKIFDNPSHHSTLELGFAAFYLNRTNQSGIFNGGMIGGRQQKGRWKIDARYYREELIRRVTAISSLKAKIKLYNADASHLLDFGFMNWPSKTLIYLDPPYYVKGKALYLDFYKHSDHFEIAGLLKRQSLLHSWMVSYDNVPEIRAMYKGYRYIHYSLNYSAREARQGIEVMFFSPGLKIPNFHL